MQRNETKENNHHSITAQHSTAQDQSHITPASYSLLLYCLVVYFVLDYYDITYNESTFSRTIERPFKPSIQYDIHSDLI